MPEKLELDFSDLKEVLENLVNWKRERDETFNLIITRESNGYVLDGVANSGGRVVTVIEDDEGDELKSGESLLWKVMEYFNFYGSKYDKERLRIVKTKEKYKCPKSK